MPKQKLYPLSARYPNVRWPRVETIIREAAELVWCCPLVMSHERMFQEGRIFRTQTLLSNLYRINSPASKAHPWLLAVQEQRARNTRGPFEVTDCELAGALA